VKRKSGSNWGRKAKRARAHAKPHQSKRKQLKNKDADASDCSTLDVALQYAAFGLPVFPLHTTGFGGCGCRNPNCSEPGKHPRVEEATTDRELIKKYWTKWRNAGIGLPLGSSSGFLALAIDGPAGQKSLRALEEKAK
jgi:hypothetical protein